MKKLLLLPHLPDPWGGAPKVHVNGQPGPSQVTQARGKIISNLKPRAWRRRGGREAQTCEEGHQEDGKVAATATKGAERACATWRF